MMRNKLKLLLALALSVAIAGCVLAACKSGPAAGDPPKIQYEAFIPNGQAGVEYDFGQCFVKENGVTYSITAFYNVEEAGKLTDVPLAVNDLKFTPVKHGEVYVALTAERGKHKVTGDEVTVKIIRAGDESEDFLTEAFAGASDNILFKVSNGYQNVPGAAVADEEENTSSNSYLAKRFDMPKSGPGSGQEGQAYGEARYELRALVQWYNVDMTNAALSIDVFRENMGDTFIVKFEAADLFYGNFVEAELADGASGSGWAVAAVEGHEGWFRVTVDCAEADLDQYVVD